MIELRAAFVHLHRGINNAKFSVALGMIGPANNTMAVVALRLASLERFSVKRGIIVRGGKGPLSAPNVSHTMQHCTVCARHRA
jgi:hypothetical protein